MTCTNDKHDETDDIAQQIIQRKSFQVLRPFVYCSVLFHKTCLFKYHVCTQIFLFGYNVNFWVK